jgi:ATP-binding cassette, subfamily B (MDR/TAP), member 1
MQADSFLPPVPQIFVMGSGAVLEKGTHNELLANDNGPYAALVSAQALNQEKKVEEDETPDSSDDTPAEQRPELLRRATTNMSGKASSYDLGEREEADESRLGLFYLAKRMYRINREQKYVYISGFVGAIASGAVYPALAILFGQSIAAFAQTDPAEIRKDSQRNGLWYFISAIVSAFAILVQNGSLSNTAEHLTAKLRSLTFRAILRQDIAFFDEEGNATGSLTSNLSDWPQKFNGLAGVTLGAIIQAISTLTIGCIVGLIFGAKLAAIGIACIPLLVTTGYIRLRLVVMKDEANRKAYASTAHLASEAAGAIKTVAALTMEKDCCDVHSAALDPPFRRSIRAAFRNNLLYATSQALAFPVIALVFYVGSRWIADGSFAVASYFTVLNSVVFAAIQAGNVFMFVPDMSKAQSSSTSIIRLSDQVPEIDCDSPAGRVLDDSAVRGHLRMDNIHFRYPSRPAVRVLRGLDLDIPAGWYVALVGPSGCGKSTCIGLLERFYDPLQGVISIDGQPITELNIASYRSQISLVSQEPTLYAGSVRFNILLGANKPSEEVTEEELVKACKDANIYDFIMSLPDGFDTFCGNKGTQLSGGQKQRIAIARALIRNPKILLLDEATSALDSQSERVVQAAIDNVIQNRNLTVVSIAHRLSTVQNANRIYYFHEGRIAEAGTHQQLIAKKGRYYELTQMQTLSKID